MKYRTHKKVYIKQGKPHTVYELYNGQHYVKQFANLEDANRYIDRRERTASSENVRLLKQWSKELNVSKDIIHEAYESEKPHGWLSKDLPNLTTSSAPYNQPRPRVGSK